MSSSEDTNPENFDQLLAELNSGLWRAPEVSFRSFMAELTSIFPAWSGEKIDVVYQEIYRVTAGIKHEPRGTSEDRDEIIRRLAKLRDAVEASLDAARGVTPREARELEHSYRGDTPFHNFIGAAEKMLSASQVLLDCPERIDLLLNRARDALPGNSAQTTQFLPFLISLFDHCHGRPPISDKGKLFDLVCAAHRFAGWGEPSGETVKAAARKYLRQPDTARRAARIWGQGTQYLDIEL